MHKVGVRGDLMTLVSKCKTFCVKNAIKQTTLVFVVVRQKIFDAKQPNMQFEHKFKFSKFCQNLRPPPHLVHL